LWALFVTTIVSVDKIDGEKRDMFHVVGTELEMGEVLSDGGVKKQYNFKEEVKIEEGGEL